jgi:hypothetical protein
MHGAVMRTMRTVGVRLREAAGELAVEVQARHVDGRQCRTPILRRVVVHEQRERLHVAAESLCLEQRYELRGEWLAEAARDGAIRRGRGIFSHFFAKAVEALIVVDALGAKRPPLDSILQGSLVDKAGTDHASTRIEAKELMK